MEHHSLDVSIACKPSVGSPTGHPMAPRSTTSVTRPEQTTLYRLVQQHAATFFAETEAAAGVDLPQFVKDEFGWLRSRNW